MVTNPLLEPEFNWSKFGKTFKQVLLCKHYPTDRDIRESRVSRRLYQRSQILIFILERINRHLSRHQGGYTVLSDKPSIEHIMPQTLSAEWKEHLDLIF